MTVSIIGLIINLVGLCFFHEHAHIGEEEMMIDHESLKKKKKSHHEEEKMLIDISSLSTVNSKECSSHEHSHDHDHNND